LSLLSSSIASAFSNDIDHPTLSVGIVSDGDQYNFLAFQLNTLNFDHKTKEKNIFWVKKVNNMVDRHGKFDPQAFEHLVQIFSVVHRLAKVDILFGECLVSVCFIRLLNYMYYKN